jgi:hypothetical protein
MKRLMISAFAAIALLAAATTTLRSHTPSPDRAVAAVMSLRDPGTPDVNKLPIKDLKISHWSFRGRRDRSDPVKRRLRSPQVKTAADGLFACHRDRHRAGKPAARDLRSDQVGCNHGRQAYQSEKLVHRKHRCRPQNIKTGFKSRLNSTLASSADRWSESGLCRPPRKW